MSEIRYRRIKPQSAHFVVSKESAVSPASDPKWQGRAPHHSTQDFEAFMAEFDAYLDTQFVDQRPAAPTVDGQQAKEKESR